MICFISDPMKNILVIKSKHDIRDYRVIKLGNDLEILIVHREGYKKESEQVNMIFNFVFKRQQY